MTSLSALNTQLIASSNSSTNQTQSASDAASADAEKQKTDFLKLLMTQLQNQNPLDPMNTDEWAAQLTRYSILQQGIETNANLQVTNDYLQKSTNSAALSYIGQDVEVSSNTASVNNGQAKWSYSVDGNPADVTLTVLDKDGKVVYDGKGSTKAGVHDFTLDMAANGINASDGYSLEIIVGAKDAEGAKVDSNVTSYANVDGVWTSSDGTYLTSGSVSYLLDSVLKIAADGSTGTTTDAGTTTTTG